MISSTHYDICKHINECMICLHFYFWLSAFIIYSHTFDQILFHMQHNNILECHIFAINKTWGKKKGQ